MQQALIDRQVLAGLVLVALLAVIGGRSWGIGWRKRLGLEPLLESRFLFLPLGMVMARAGLFNQAVVHELNALVTLGLGVLGLLLGLSHERVSPRLGRATACESGFTLLLVGLPAYVLLERAGTLGWQQRAAAAALLGCAAAISGNRLTALAEALGQRQLHSVRQMADLSTTIGVLAAGLLLALLPAGGPLNPLERVLLLAAIGAIGGLAAWLLISETRSPALRTTFLLGMLLLTAGTATHIGLSPVAATLVMGLTAANLPGTLAGELRDSMAFLEAPLRVVLLVIAGAALPAVSGFAVASLGVFLALRTAGKVLGGRIAAVVAKDDLPPRAGLGLLPSSAVALGLALDFQATASGLVADVVVTTVVLGSFFSESAGIWTTWLLARAQLVSDATFEIVVEAAEPVAQAHVVGDPPP